MIQKFKTGIDAIISSLGLENMSEGQRVGAMGDIPLSIKREIIKGKDFKSN